MNENYSSPELLSGCRIPEENIKVYVFTTLAMIIAAAVAFFYTNYETYFDQACRRLFNYVDADESGLIDFKELELAVAIMFGEVRLYCDFEYDVG
jgi:hypothetical protein